MKTITLGSFEGGPALFMIGVATAAGREEADRDDKRRLHYRGPKLASRYRYARKYDPPSYRGSSSQRTTCFWSTGRWRDRRLGPISL